MRILRIVCRIAAVALAIYCMTFGGWVVLFYQRMPYGAALGLFIVSAVWLLTADPVKRRQDRLKQAVELAAKLKARQGHVRVRNAGIDRKFAEAEGILAEIEPLVQDISSQTSKDICKVFDRRLDRVRKLLGKVRSYWE